MVNSKENSNFLNRRGFLKFSAAAAASLLLKSCKAFLPQKEIPQTINLYTYLVRSPDANYFISRKNILEEDDRGLRWIRPQDGISNVYRWTKGSEPELLDQVGALTSNLAPNPNGGVTFAAQGEIFTLPPNSAGVTSIYKPASVVDAIAVSSKGQVAFKTSDESLHLLEDGHERRLTPEGIRVLNKPVWSPDGKQIAYVHYKTDPTRYIEIADADGSNVRQISTKYSEQPVWSPDGKRLAFIAGMSLFSQEMADSLSIPTKLITPNQVSPRNPAYSPDGKLIAYVANEGFPIPHENGGGQTIGESGLYIVNADGGQSKKVIPGGVSEFVWENGNTISYIENQNSGSTVKTTQI